MAIVNWGFGTGSGGTGTSNDEVNLFTINTDRTFTESELSITQENVILCEAPLTVALPQVNTDAYRVRVQREFTGAGDVVVELQS